ncbi:MAG: sugar transferase, partial [Acidobacteriota bacterium]
FDLLLASILLLLMLPIAVVIMAVLAVIGDHRVIYRQRRVGKAGDEFRMFKFVTMRRGSGAMGTGSLTLPGDPRVLPFGRFLRKMKLNELPQLINVILGDMSLVGPRPQPPDIFSHYPDEAREYIVQVRPGITGVGAVVFRDEERLLEESPLPAQECHRDIFVPIKAELETWYVDHHGFVVDVKLVLLTAIAVFVPNGRMYAVGLKSLGLPPWLAAGPEMARRAAGSTPTATATAPEPPVVSQTPSTAADSAAGASATDA